MRSKAKLASIGRLEKEVKKMYLNSKKKSKNKISFKSSKTQSI